MAPSPATRPVPVVLSYGGSILLTGEHDGEFLARVARKLRAWGEELPLVVTVGGGRVAREYIRLGREVGLTEVELDELGIEVTRLNARLLASLVGPPCPSVPPSTLAAAVHEIHRVSPVILGGTEPGHTTDGVAALIAERLRAARVVNATSVDGLYERDPRQDPRAARIDRLDWARFRAILDRSADGSAGQRFVFDRLGAQSLERSGIPLRIVHGRDLDNVERALRGAGFEGTEVR
jgi:uridylate kinase